MKFKLYLVLLFICFFGVRVIGQNISITTTSNSSTWSPVKIANSGSTLQWTASNSRIGELTQTINDPSFNFSANNGSLISISIQGSNGFTGLTNLRILSSNIVSIDLTGTTDLRNIFLTGNGITDLNVNGDTQLTRLLLANNNLNSLDITNNLLINDLRIDRNNLSSTTLNDIINKLDGFGISNGILKISANAGDLTSSAQPAFDNLINKGWTIDVGAPPNAPSDQESPSAVVDLSSSNTTAIGTNLNWTASTDNVGVVDYEVFQDGNSIGLTGGNINFSVGELSPNSVYTFIVFAMDAAGNTSEISNSEIVTTEEDTDSPSQIIDLSENNTTSTTTDLSWTGSSDNVGVVNYEVFQDGLSIGQTGGAVNFNVSGLSASTNYAFSVFAIDGAGNLSLESNVLNVLTLSVPDSEPPSTITDLTSGNITLTSTDLLWSASTDNIGVTDYEVFQNGVSIGLTGNMTSINVVDLISNVTYVFTVVAFDAAGNSSSISNTENVTTLSDNESPTPVTDLNATNTMVRTTDLSWSASSDNVAVVDYEIFQDGLSIGVSGGLTSFGVTGLGAGNSYAFTVFALDAVGNTSTVSNTVNVTTLDAVNYTSDNSNLSDIDWVARDLFADRNVGIGTTETQGYRLAVAGKIVAEEIKVALQNNWPDYVFLKDYSLPNLYEVEKYIRKNGHLKNIPGSKEVEDSGINLGEMNGLLLRKIEELTLYTIDQQKKIDNLEKNYNEIRTLLEELKNSDSIKDKTNSTKRK